MLSKGAENACPVGDGELCWTLSWSPRRCGKGFGGVAGTSYRVFKGSKFALLCFFLLWNLPALLWWSPQLVASVCSGGFLAWPYLDDWLGWSHGSCWSKCLFRCLDCQGWGVEQTFLISLLGKCYVMFGVLALLQTEPDSYIALLFLPLEAESEGRHFKLVVISDVSCWKAPGLCDVHAWLEASFDHDIVDLIVVFSSWTVTCPTSRWFVWTKCVQRLQVVVTGEF